MSKAAFDPEKQEPKENDKCMEPSNTEREENGGNWRHRLTEFGNRTKNFASDNFRLVIILLCIMLIVFFIIIIVLAVLLGKSHCENPVYCSDSQCLSAAASIVSKMNSSIDPCSDFFEYSCKEWKKVASHRSGSYAITDSVKENVFFKIRYLIDLISADNENDNTPNGKIKIFYSTCMNEGEIDYWSSRTLLKSIEEVGGWAILKGSSMKSSWDRSKVLAKLQASFGVHAFFKINVGADNRNPTRNIIKMYPSGLGLPAKSLYFENENNKYLQAYKDFIQNIIREFATPTIAEKFANDMFSYEKRLAHITPDPERIISDDQEYKILSINELNSLSPVINWLDLLQTYYPNADISMSTEVAVLFEDYFRLLSQLISTTDNFVLNDYMMWQFVSSYIPHLSKKERKISNKFYQILADAADVNYPSRDRWEFCIDQTVHYLGHAVSAMYVHKYFPSKTKLDVQQMVENIRSSVIEQINSFSWLSGIEKESAQEKIRLLDIQIGHPEFILNNEKLEAYYESLPIKSTHILNIFQGEVFLKSKEEQLLAQPFSMDQSWNIFSVDVKSKYSYAGNNLVIPAGLLNFPIYHVDSPIAMKYGSLAAHIANKLSQALDIRGIDYQMNGLLDPWLGNNSKDAYRISSDCLLQHIMTNENINLRLHSNLTMLDLMNDIKGIKFSLSAYKNIKDDNGLIPGLNKGYDQLFFISYAQSLCQTLRPETIVTLNDQYPLPNRIRVLLSLQQLPEFRKSFNCPDSSAMIAKKQCNI